MILYHAWIRVKLLPYPPGCLIIQKKRRICDSDVIRANTRFAPTKDFQVAVGVNLVFTRYFETASLCTLYISGYPANTRHHNGE